jgi:cytochrome c-type biogenesis protein CcmH
MSDTAAERAKLLAAELRCLVCQNQTIADSNASLAVDLRRKVAEQIAAGRSDAEIRQYMVERYGEFILYKPPLTARNAALWAGPFVLLAVGGLVAAVAVRRRRLRAGGAGPPSGEPVPDEAGLAAIEARWLAERGGDPAKPR